MWADYDNVFYEDGTFKKSVEFMNDTPVISIHKDCKIIGDSTFRNCNTLSEIILPEGLEEIEIEAFSGCCNLRKLTLPSTLKVLGEDAFSGCPVLPETIVIPDGVKIIEKGAFSFDTHIKHFKLGKDTKILGANALLGCYLLKTIDLANVEVIRKDSIPDSVQLTRIELPSSLKEIDPFATSSNAEIYFAGTKSDFLEIKGGKEFLRRYEKQMHFEKISLDKMFANGKSLKDINSRFKEDESIR